MKNILRKEGFQAKFFLSIALAIYFIFGFYHLSDFISADEHFWLPNSGTERIKDYWTAVEKGKWKDTRINDKPGITLAYTSGIAMLIDDGKGQITENGNTIKRFDPERTKRINFLYRLPILLVSGFFSLFFFWIIKKITGDEWIALFSASGILLSPILLGISQIVNPDSLFWIFGAAALFSFYAFLQFSERKLAILASVFFGLGLATKYVSIIFIPFFFFAIIAYYFLEFGKWEGKNSDFRSRVIRNGLAYLGIIFGGFLIFALMMPASFVEPKVFYLGTIGFPGMEKVFWATMGLNFLVLFDAWIFQSRVLWKLLQKSQSLQKIVPKIFYLVLTGTVIFVLVNWLTRNSLIDLSGISFDMKRKDAFSEFPLYTRYIMEFVPLVFALTPVALFSLAFIWIKSFFHETRQKTFVFFLSTFFLVFYFAVIEQGLLVTVRYSIILFPLVMVLGAIALSEFFSKNGETENTSSKKAFLVFLVTLVILFISSLVQQNFFADDLKSAYVNRVYRSWYSIPLFLMIIGGISVSANKYLPWKKITQIPKVWIFGFLVIFNVISILLITPFYFSYTNDLLPKNYIISGAWGYGGYEAAEYLNSQPNAENLTVWTDVYGVCEFFAGKCIHKAKVDVAKYPIDYYFRSLQATIPLNFPHPMEDRSIWSRQIDGRSKSFLKINKALPATSNNINTSENSNNSASDAEN